MNGYQARMYLRKESRKGSEGSVARETRGGRRTSDAMSPEEKFRATSPSPSHPPVMNGHCSRMVLQGRRDTCSANQYSSPQRPSGEKYDKIGHVTPDQPPRRSSTSHPPVMSGHCARMFATGRRDSCSGTRYPLFEEPRKIFPAQEMLQDLKSNWRTHGVLNGKPKERGRK